MVVAPKLKIICKNPAIPLQQVHLKEMKVDSQRDVYTLRVTAALFIGAESRKLKSLSRIRVFATPLTAACQTPLSTGFFWQVGKLKVRSNTNIHPGRNE